MVQFHQGVPKTKRFIMNFSVNDRVYDNLTNRYGTVTEVCNLYLCVRFDNNQGGIAQFRISSAERDLTKV